MSRICLCVVVFLLQTAGIASAAFIDFAALTLGPSDSMTLGDVTFRAAGGYEGSQVAIVQGEGLGVATAGSAGSFDRIIDWVRDTDGSWIPGSTREEDGLLDITVNGALTAITLRTFMIMVDGTPPTAFPEVEMGWYARGIGGVSGPGGHLWYPANETIRIEFMDWADGVPPPSFLNEFGMMWDFPPEAEYLDVLNRQDSYAKLHYGFSLVSMEYTPNPVPEPRILPLAGIGLILLLACQQFVRTGQAPTWGVRNLSGTPAVQCKLQVSAGGL